MRTTNRNQVKQFCPWRKFCPKYFLYWHKLLFLRCITWFFHILNSVWNSNQDVSVRRKGFYVQSHHVHGSLVTALCCAVLALLIHSHLKYQEGHPLSTLTPPWLPWQWSVGQSGSDCSQSGSPHAARWVHWQRWQTDRPSAAGPLGSTAWMWHGLLPRTTKPQPTASPTIWRGKPQWAISRRPLAILLTFPERESQPSASSGRSLLSHLYPVGRGRSTLLLL